MMSSRSIIERYGRTVWGIALATVTATAAVGCKFMDPTEVNNPATTEDDLAEAKNPTASLIPGLRAMFARTVSRAFFAEVISDNYSIHGTGINKTYDTPTEITEELLGSMYDFPQELRSLAAFVLNDIVPLDDNPDAADVQEARYYHGMAYLMLGEWFVAVPVEVDGTPVPSATLIQTAITELEAAGTGGTFGLEVRAALARAYRLAGDVANAETHASAVLAADANFLQARDFDGATITNTLYGLLFLRSLKEMQPLPRLDFLDLKYTSREAPIYVSKAEEMHLILAEADFSRDAFAAGRQHLVDAIRLALTRPTEDFDDDDQRLNLDLSERPHDAIIDIRADASSPFRSGLVLTRPGTITTPTVASTSLDPDSILAILPTETESLLHAFFLARQEMLFLEGRRMVDLGIKVPMTLEEIEANPSINVGDLGTVVFVPSYIPALDNMDLFTPASPYDAAGALTTTQVTIMVDMNRVLAQMKVSPFGL